MKVPTRGALLKELDGLGYGARLGRVAVLARDAKGSPGLEALLAELERGDTYEATLAVEMARASGDSARLVRALMHPSLVVRGRATAFAAAVASDEALESILPSLPPETRKRLLGGIVRADRGALAVRLFPKVLARFGAAEAAHLTSALDAPTLARALPEVGHRVHSWDSLALRQPAVVLAYVRERIAAAPERERPYAFALYGSALTTLILTHSAEVLALARELGPPDALPHALYKRMAFLTRHHPEQVLALLTRPSYRARLLADGLPRGLLQELHAFTESQLLTLARALADAPGHLALLLDALPPSRRAAVFAHAAEGNLPRQLPDVLLVALPHAARDAQAARMLDLREVREDRARTLYLLAFRAIEHAREPLTQAAFAAKAEDRALALTYLVRSTGLSRRGMTETLAQLSRLKNEQDPVRLAALQALSQVPPTVFRPEHAPALAQLADWVVEARDTSHGTRQAVQALAFRLMRAHVMEPDGPMFQLALTLLKKLARQSESLALPPLERDLPRGAEVRIVSALLPTIRSAATRESYALVLALASALGRRAWNVDLLQPLLEPVTETTPEGLARAAIQLWLAPPRTRDARVRKLLDRDETTITLPIVFEHLHRRRQEWLDPFLQGRALRGRFLTGKTGYVPPATRGFHRWLPRQQRSLAAILTRVAADPQRSTWERAQVLSTLPHLPVVDAAALTPFVKDKEVPVAEAALGALAWLDRPDTALAPLLEHLDSDRARVAMYAVPRVARLIPGERLAAELEALLGREKLRVTVHKEVIRLLGAFRSEKSLALLRREASKPTLHRDVRIAVGHAARQLLDDEEAWTLLGELARSPDAYVARSLLDASPVMLRPEERPRYLGLLLEVSRHADLEVRREAFRVLPWWAAGAEERVAKLAAERVLELAKAPEWREAAQALVEVVRDGRAVDVLVSTVAALGAPAADAPNATPDRDQPARQRLLALCSLLLGLPRAVRLRSRALLSDVAKAVGKDATLWPMTARLRLAGAEWRDAGAAVALVAGLAGETRDEPLFGLALMDAVRDSLEGTAAEWTPEVLLAVADGLTEQAPLAAVAFVGAAGPRLRWGEEAARRLRALREHPRVAVRAAACAVFTAGE